MNPEALRWLAEHHAEVRLRPTSGGCAMTITVAESKYMRWSVTDLLAYEAAEAFDTCLERLVFRIRRGVLPNGG